MQNLRSRTRIARWSSPRMFNFSCGISFGMLLAVPLVAVLLGLRLPARLAGLLLFGFASGTTDTESWACTRLEMLGMLWAWLPPFGLGGDMGSLGGETWSVFIWGDLPGDRVEFCDAGAGLPCGSVGCTGGSEFGGAVMRGSIIPPVCNARCAIDCCSATILSWAVLGLGCGAYAGEIWEGAEVTPA